ncbi:Calcium-dependent lipid-binding family protein [Perilla frutescens var. frutescens]|nr:Calcium-dependent lipid-binding family protein [Perilla frutescens var. frutescens]
MSYVRTLEVERCCNVRTCEFERHYLPEFEGAIPLLTLKLSKNRLNMEFGSVHAAFRVVIITVLLSFINAFLNVSSISVVLLQMLHGKLEVVLVSANGLENTNFLINTDAYATIKCQDQEKTSKVATVEGSAPTWNETFMFAISEDVKVLKIRIMDKDTLTSDDFVGEVTVPLEPAFEVERVPVTMYNVVKVGTLCGGINVSLKFTHQKIRSRGFSGEDLGRWKPSSTME